MEDLIIVGIDPGTTAAFSVLDINGKLIKNYSSKNLGLSNLISMTISYGDVVLVGTDKKKCPGLIESFAVKTGAKIAKPEQDLLLKEKKELLNNIRTKNSHEADSLASALFAYKSFLPLFKKIDSFVKIRKKKNISNRIKKLVITKGISISDALNLIEMPEEKKESRKKRESAIKKEEYESLKNRLREERNKNSILTSQNSELKILLKKSGKDKERLEKRSMGVVDDKKAKKILEFREQRILSFEKEIKQKNKEIEKLQKEISDINRIMANIERDLIAKKLENLGSKEFLKKSKDLNIKKEDLILVNDPNIFSEKTIDFFKGRTEVIISKKNPNKKLSELFNFINKENLSIKERKSFAVISRKDLENQKKKINILSRIVNEYKKNRQK